MESPLLATQSSHVSRSCWKAELGLQRASDFPTFCPSMKQLLQSA